MDKTLTLTEFAKDVLEGLTAERKYLSSKYFYDERGSKIFQDIMRMPEYYLTDCELEILETHKQNIFEIFTNTGNAFDLIELGAGDGLKTKILLKHFIQQTQDFSYIPIDISEDVVLKLTSELEALIPGLQVKGKIGDYFDLIGEMSKFQKRRKVLLFLGSNIGNFEKEELSDFLAKLRSVMLPSDFLLIGFDLKKDPEVILKAYDDPHGHTAAFNLNILRRINEELGGNFDLKKFRHKETYDAETGETKSFLVSLAEQNITIKEANTSIFYEKGEHIFTELSRKYDMSMINQLAEGNGFEVEKNYFDRRRYFVDSLWKLK